MTLDIILIIIGGLLILGGFVGSVLPVLPGIPLSYLGLICLQFTSKIDYSWQFLLIWGLVVVAIQVLDYFVPIWGTKKFGGGRKGAWGSALGVVAGIFIFPPFGIILGPFVGAVIGELIDKKTTKQALWAGFGSFIGFLAGTVMKLALATVFAFFYVKDILYIIKGAL